MTNETEADEILNKARNLSRVGKTAEAIVVYTSADQLYMAKNDLRGRTRCWSGIAKAYGKQRKFRDAVVAFEKTAGFALEAAWPDKEIEALYNKGLTLQQMGAKEANLEEIGEAIEAFRRALAVAKRINDRSSGGVLLLSLGFACAWAKRDDEAISYFKAAEPFALQGVDFDTAFSALSGLGVLLSNKGRAVEAIVYLERALELAKSVEGDLVAVADTFANLGVAYEKAGRLDDAIEAVDTYREILQQAGDVKVSNAQAMLRRLQNKKLEK